MKIARDHSDVISELDFTDENTVRELYAMHYPPLCYFAEKLVKDKRAAEDIAVDSFLKFLKKKQEFDNLKDIKSFLFTVARNACFDYLREARRREKGNRELEYLSEPDERFGENEMITAKVLQSIYSEVENLPLQCRRVFKSIFLEGKNTGRVAAELGISTQTVLNHKSKALRILRLNLYKEGLFSGTALLSCLALFQYFYHL